MTIIKMPTSLTCYYGNISKILLQFNSLIPKDGENILDFIDIHAHEKIVFDFSKTTFLSAELTTFLSALWELLFEYGYKDISIFGMNNKIESILSKNGFLEYYQLGAKKTDYNQTTISFLKAYSQDDQTLRKYLVNNVLSNKNWPSHLSTDGAEIEIINSALSELTLNISEHSGSNIVLACGQFFPQKHRLEFSIADIGKSIPNNIKNRKGDIVTFENDSSYIDWATDMGHSTKNIAASGLGLFDIKTNLLHNGELTIISNYGYWKQMMSSEINKQDLPSPFKGTLIHLNFSLSNKDLTNEYEFPTQELFF